MIEFLALSLVSIQERAMMAHLRQIDFQYTPSENLLFSLLLACEKAEILGSKKKYLSVLLSATFSPTHGIAETYLNFQTIGYDMPICGPFFLNLDISYCSKEI